MVMYVIARLKVFPRVCERVYARTTESKARTRDKCNNI